MVKIYIVFVKEYKRSERAPPGPMKSFSATKTNNSIEEGDFAEDVDVALTDANNDDLAVDESSREGTANHNERRPSNGLQRDCNHRPSKLDSAVPPLQHVPRVLPKNEDPKLVSRNKRLLDQLLGTLENVGCGGFPNPMQNLNKLLQLQMTMQMANFAQVFLGSVPMYPNHANARAITTDELFWHSAATSSELQFSRSC